MAGMEGKDSLVRDSFILFSASSLVNLSNFVFHSFASRLLGPESYGVLVTLLAVIVIVAMPSLALQMTIVKKTSIFRAHGKFGSIEKLFRLTSVWFLVIGTACMLVFTAIGMNNSAIKEFFHIQDPALYYILGAISLIMLVLPVVRGILQGMQNFIGLGISLVTDAVIRLAFLYVFVNWFSWGVRGAVSTTLAGGLTSYILGFFLIAYIFRFKEDEGEVVTKTELFSYARPVFFSMLGFALLSYIDVFTVKHFFNSNDAGLYSATSMIGKAFLYFPSAIAMTLFPKVSESHELNRGTKALLYRSLGLTAAISIAGVVFCYFFPRVIIGIMFGEKFYAIEGIVRLFGAAIFPLVLFNVVINYALAVHRYAFIYIMFGGILLYAALLWFFHRDFYQVISVLFGVTLTILILTILSLKGEAKTVENGV
ncbi:MAG: oligosaccharide flippase family protein [Candidatus Goldiibacteriota bacterium]|jgi:O-antigen/teichoic acid export membrane protein